MERIGLHLTYYRDQDPSEPTQYARQIWFNTLSKIAPHVLKDLRDKALPIYQKYFGTRRDGDSYPDWCELKELKKLSGVARIGFEYQDYVTSVERWSAEWNMGAEWVEEEAHFLLSCWDVDADSRASAEVPQIKQLELNGIPLYERELHRELVQRLSEPDMFWDTARETPEAWAKRVKHEVDLFVELARDYVTDTPQKRNLEHYKWAVLRQVYGYSAESIAGTLGISQASVDEALRNIFETIDLKPRRLKAGRPKGHGTDERRVEIDLQIHRLLRA